MFFIWFFSQISFKSTFTPIAPYSHEFRFYRGVTASSEHLLKPTISQSSAYREFPLKTNNSFRPSHLKFHRELSSAVFTGGHASHPANTPGRNGTVVGWQVTSSKMDETREQRARARETEIDHGRRDRERETGDSGGERESARDDNLKFSLESAV